MYNKIHIHRLPRISSRLLYITTNNIWMEKFQVLLIFALLNQDTHFKSFQWIFPINMLNKFQIITVLES